jgi:hypothetical protein
MMMGPNAAKHQHPEPAIRKVGIVVHRDGLTAWHRRLVEALNALPISCALQVFVLPPRQSGLSGWLRRISLALDHAVARQPRQSIDARSLAGSTTSVLDLTPDQLVAHVSAAGIDLLIDLRCGLPSVELRAAAAGGVLQVWYCGAPDDLSFTSGRLHKGKPEPLAVTLWKAAGRAPETQHACQHAPSGGHLLYDRGLLAGRAVAYLTRSVRGSPTTGDVSSTNALGHDHATPPPPATVLARSTAAVIRTLVDRVRWRSAPPDQWFIAYQQNPAHFISRGHALSRSGFRTVGHRGRRFYADPMVIDWQGRTHVFFEDYEYRRRVGVIVHAMLQDDGELTPPECVLERPYHLSYPFVFDHGGEVYMVPETSANQTVELYRAADFPKRWELVATLLTGVNAVDATLHHDGTCWWMFVNIGEHGSCTNDELFIYQSQHLTGTWQPHVANPVKTGLSGTRPAGPLFSLDGQLLRPAQDCSTLYGGGLVLNAIDRLSATEFAEHPIERFAPSMLGACDGLHTLSASSRIEIIDARRAGT